MKHVFELPDFPQSSFVIESSFWTGKSIIYQDGVQVEQSKEKGKPFLLKSSDGQILKAYAQNKLPEMVPELEINGIKYEIIEKLEWYQYAIGGLPILLVFVGGAIGALIGIFASINNFKIFRSEGTTLSKYVKVTGIVVLAYLAYLVLAGIISSLVNSL